MKRGQTLVQPLDRLAKRVLTSLRSQRVLGWFLISTGLMGLLVELTTARYINQPAALLTLIGVYLLLRAYRLFDQSDSLERLYAQQAGKATKKLSALLHQAPLKHTPKTKDFLPGPQSIAVLVLGSLVVASPFLVLSGAYVSLVACVVLALSVSGLAFLAHKKRPIWFALCVLVTTSFLLLAVTMVRTESLESVMVTICSIAYLVTISYAVAITKQTLENRRLFPALVLLAVPAFLLAFAATSSLLEGVGLFVAGVAVFGIVAAMSLLAWHRHGRDSFAKYLLLTAVGVVVVLLYQVVSAPALVVIWLLMSIPALVIGMQLPSYSARLVGVTTLALAVLHYLFGVLGGPVVIVPIELLSPSLWVGVILSATLALTGWWYQETQVLKGRETRLQALAAPIGRALAATLLLTAVLSSADSFIRLFGTIFWIAVVAFWAVARKSGRGLAAALGGGMVLVTSLLVIDLSTSSFGLKMVLYVLASIIGITLLGILTWNHLTRNFTRV